MPQVSSGSLRSQVCILPAHTLDLLFLCSFTMSVHGSLRSLRCSSTSLVIHALIHWLSTHPAIHVPTHTQRPSTCPFVGPKRIWLLSVFIHLPT